MIPGLAPSIGFGLFLALPLLLACSNRESKEVELPNLGLDSPDRFADLAQRRTNYVCGDGGTFTLILGGRTEQFAWLVDGANALPFNLYEQPAQSGRRYGDGVIDVIVDSSAAEVVVSGTSRYTDCELRTRYYDCPAGPFFGLETLGVAEEQAIIEDGTNRKMFTLDRMDPAGLMYGDGVILVDRTGPVANVFVEGQLRFANCTLRPV